MLGDSEQLVDDLNNDDVRVSLYREATLGSFWSFCDNILWNGDFLMDPSERRRLSACHGEFCRWLELPKPAKTPRKRLALWPRGSLKSNILSVAYPVWRMLRDPNIRILIVSSTYKLSRRLLSSIRGVLESEPFIFRYGNLVSTVGWRDECITIATRTNKSLKDPTVSTGGVDASEIGGHYDLIIYDDLHDRVNSQTADQIQKVFEYWQLLMPMLEPGGDMEGAATRWGDADAYSKIIELLPPECVSVRKAEEGGILLFPEKLTHEFLYAPKVGMRDTLGPYLFSCFYFNEPVPDDQATFRSDWLEKCLWRDASWPLGLQYYVAVDPAIAESEGSDFTAMAVCGVDEVGTWHIVEAVNKHLSPTELINTMFDLVERYHPRKVGIETVSYQKALRSWTEQEMGRRQRFFVMEELRPGQRSKELRIRGLVPRIEQANVRWRPEMDVLTDQFRRFPRGKHDDLIDAIAYLQDLVPPINKKGDVTVNDERNFVRGVRFGREAEPEGDWMGSDFDRIDSLVA